MTREKLSKATELSRHIHRIEINLRDIKYCEDNYSDYPIQVRFKRTSNDTVFTDVDIYDEELKKEILNLVKIHFISDIQKSEKEQEQKKKEQEEKDQNKDWMYQQRERNELGADYFSYQGYHPPKK